MIVIQIQLEYFTLRIEKYEWDFRFLSKMAKSANVEYSKLQDEVEDEIPSYQESDPNLHGEIASPISSQGIENEFNTLDEPVKDTIMRDLRAVGTKFFHVLYPKQKAALLKDWDLWGPLILCVFLAMMLQGTTEEADSLSKGGPQFAEVFVIVWLGAVVVTLNSKLLGGKISFFQSVCVLGYCLLAPCLSLIICQLILLAPQQTVALFIIRFIVTMFGFAWATFASTAFLGDSQPPKRKALAVYPIFLFYFVISWLIISHSP
ncbi:protein YIPF6-like [Limulus polyphemus]|uniref:Protein YIPF n=1 Tax=Limulus polyphemus TaxID=6850 RepID=A0ABM1BXL5_LIMPO|nr:protein YIPF6-like [Limulus polyphemus]